MTRALAPALLLTFCACGQPTPMPAPIPEFTLEAMGEGATNGAPLWPLTTGQQFGHFVVRAPVPFGGFRAWPFASTRPYTYGDGPSPELPGKVFYFANGSAGELVLVGDSRRGVFATPATWLPTTVRVGMRWSTGKAFDGGPRFITRVVSRAVEPTMAGERTVWGLEVFDRETFFPDQANTQLLRGALFLWRYAEGIGPLDDGRDDHQRLAVPLQPNAALDDTPSNRLTMRPVNGGARVAEDFLPRWGSVVDTVEAPGPIGFVGASSLIAPSDFTGGVTVGSNDAVLCLSETGSTAGSCRSAIAALPLADGTVAELRASGLQADRSLSCELNPGPGCQTYTLNALWLGRDGGAQVAEVSGVVTQVAPWSPGTARPSFIGQEPPLAPRLPRFANTLLWPARPEEGARFIAPTLPSLHTVSLDTGRTRVGPRIEQTLGFHVSAEGHDYLLVHHDGRLEELTVTAEGVRIAVLGLLDLPAGHVPLSAVRRDGRILVITNTGFRGRDAQMTLEGFDGTRRPQHGEAFVWEVDDVRPTTFRAPLPIETLELRASGRDVTVCWQGGDGSAPTGTWSLGGAPARVLWSEGDGCATVLRTPQQEVLDDWPGTFSLEGEFTVGGRFVFGETALTARAREEERAQFFNHEVPLAPLVGGGFVGSSRYSSALEVEQVIDFRTTDSCRADLGGEGLWCSGVLLDRTGVHFVAGADGGRPVVQGGGVLVGDTVLHGDGGARQVNLAGADAGWIAGAVLSNGVAVGREDNGFNAVAVKDGAIVWHAPVGLEELVMVGDAVWGRTLGTFRPATGLTRIETLDGGARSWTWGELLGDGAWAATATWATTPSGRVFALISEDRAIQYSHTLWELTPMGPQRLDARVLRAFGDKASLTIAADDHALAAWPTPGTGERVDPRDIVRVPLAP